MVLHADVKPHNFFVSLYLIFVQPILYFGLSSQKKNISCECNHSLFLHISILVHNLPVLEKYM